MKIDGVAYRSVWVDDDGWSVRIFDQTKLPWTVEILRLTDVAATAHAIRSMQVRGAPLTPIFASTRSRSRCAIRMGVCDYLRPMAPASWR